MVDAAAGVHNEWAKGGRRPQGGLRAAGTSTQLRASRPDSDSVRPRARAGGSETTPGALTKLLAAVWRKREVLCA